MQRCVSRISAVRPAFACIPPSKRIRLASTASARTQCSSCGADLGGSTPTVARCPSCSAFTPPPAIDGPPTHFELFELPTHYSLDRADLRRRFLRWQQRVHPDTVRGDGTQAQWARDWSGRVNAAYRALDEPLPRAEYMLALEGAEVQEADQADDPTLLMEILETREALEDAQTEEDVAAIRSDNKQTIEATVAGLAEAFNAGDVKAAKNLSIKLRYYQNVEDVCREWTPGAEITLQH